MLLGAVADDLTGATDLSLMLSREGMKTIQVIDVPQQGFDFGDADAVVVALKSRTVPVNEAVSMSLQSARALLAAGAEQLLFKYCSTFDSTDEGNIGPVAEALMELVGTDLTIACPAFPAAGRSIYQGHLFVGGKLLSESPMKDHPLTPMRDANLVRFLQRQTKGKVGLVDLVSVEAGAQSVRDAFAAARADGIRIVIVDAIRDADLRTIGEACYGMPLITGGSGIAMGLPANFRAAGKLELREPAQTLAAPAGRAVIIAGSCSVATRGQIEAAIAAGVPALQVGALEIADGKISAAEIVDWIVANSDGRPPLVYSSADPDVVGSVQAELGRERAGQLVEDMLAEVGKRLLGHGFTRFLIAGGETSGAVVSALGVNALEIGPEIDPGVPWTRSSGGARLALALKSGNFGSRDFFVKAWDLLCEDGVNG
ncbi:3-oxo-tetronate kinase [Oricola nitratireducens]|uniref:3-oxo-tetronate kinase n=1 Tax=Oricola nitratireducens TaxID=2775868 RepID=UPI00186786D3|nr:3-oxo-tetronate kinase [Oricola nitratireducens]